MPTATLIRFNTPFSQPPPSFYTGTGATDLVPGIYPIALNGRPYMLDMASGAFQRQFDTRIRDSVDQSADPGEAALSSQGLWRRSQTAWHYGAGQLTADASDSEQFFCVIAGYVKFLLRGGSTTTKQSQSFYLGAFNRPPFPLFSVPLRFT